MEPLDLLRTLFGRWRLVAAAALVAALAAGLTASASKATPLVREYEATAVLITSETTVVERPLKLSTLALLTTAGEVPQRAAEALGYKGPAALLSRSVSVANDPEVGSLTITARDLQAGTARAKAEAFASALLEFLSDRNALRQERELARAAKRLEALQASIRALDRRVGRAGGASAELLRAERDAQVRQYSFAYESYQSLASREGQDAGMEILQEPEAIPIARGGFTAPRGRLPRIAIASILGLMLGAGIALALERLDERVRSRAQAENGFGFPVLAEIPNRRGASVGADPQSPVAAAFRLVRAGLTDRRFAIAPASEPTEARTGHGAFGFLGPANQPLFEWSGPASNPRRAQAILVTSPGMREGKTTVVANLATVLAETGARALAVSADFRRPALHRMLGVPEEPGLIQAITEGKTPQLHHATVPGVACVPSGGVAENPAALLGSESATAALKTLRARADFIVVDGTGLLDASDATSLISQVDGILVVARAGRTSVDAARRTGEFLRRMNAPVRGVVLIGAHSGLAGALTWFRRSGRVARPEPDGAISLTPSTNGNHTEHGTVERTAKAIDVVTEPEPAAKQPHATNQPGVQSELNAVNETERAETPDVAKEPDAATEPPVVEEPGIARERQ